MVDIDGTRIKVSLDQESAGSVVRGCAAQMEDSLTMLRNKLAELESVWTGDAKTEYLALRTQWSTAAQDLFGQDGLLGTIGNALDNCWDNYHGSEEANLKTWCRH